MTTIPASAVRQIEHRVLALHYAVLADLLSKEGTVSRAQLEGFCRETARHHEALHDSYDKKERD